MQWPTERRASSHLGEADNQVTDPYNSVPWRRPPYCDSALVSLDSDGHGTTRAAKVNNCGLAYLLNRLSGKQHRVAGPLAPIGVSNFFELAVAAAISLFGFQSGAALAAVVGVLIEVPVMPSVVWIVNRSKGWYEDGKVGARTVEDHGVRNDFEVRGNGI